VVAIRQLDNKKIDLAVRVGIATGPVVVGDLLGQGAAQEAAITGETPNLAGRLQSLAGARDGRLEEGGLSLRASSRQLSTSRCASVDQFWNFLAPT
jgi:class 3 adenylate cyclase